MSRRHDALVVGGGLAGAAVAHDLARAGRDVLLVEREAKPHDKVCGEFLSFEALRYLRDLDVDPQALGAAPIEAVGVAGRGRLVSCPLPFPALSLSRRRLDEALLDRARQAGARLLLGTSVRTLARADAAWTARLADGKTFDAAEAFVATGKHDLRERRRPPGSQNDLVGLKLHFRLSPAETAALARRVELFLFPGGYGGLQPIENGAANLCLLVQKRRFALAGARWERLLEEIGRECPHLGRRLSQAEPVQDRPLAVASIPYGFVLRGATDCWRLGDQAAVIPSFAGQGMSIALHSARLAASSYLAGASPGAFQRRLAADVSAQVRRATWLSRLLVQGWAQRIGLAGVRQTPTVLAGVASATRIKGTALRRTRPS